MKAHRILLFLLPLLLMPAARAAEDPVRWSARLVPADARAGEAAQVVVEASIQPPWHIYSTKKYDIGPRPTVVALKQNPVLSAAGAVAQPAPHQEMDPG